MRILFVLFVLIFVPVLALADEPVVPSKAEATTVKYTLDQIPKYRRVTVSVVHGVATLGGNTDLSPTEAQELTTLVKGFEGIRYVNNNVKDERTFLEHLEPAIRKISGFGMALLSNVPLYLLGLAVLIFFWFLGSVAARWIIRVVARKASGPTVENLIRRVAKLVALILGLSIVLEMLGLASVVGAVLGSAGVLGIAVGFALKDWAENQIAGLMLSIRRPFELKDLIEVDSYKGKVVEINTRETVLMTVDGNHLRIPNALIFKSVLFNYTRNPARRFDFRIRVRTDEDLPNAISVGVEAIKNIEGVLAEPKPFGLVSELGDSTISVQMYGWVNQEEFGYSRIKSEGIRRVKEQFELEGIEIPTPTNRVLLSESGTKSISPSKSE